MKVTDVLSMQLNGSFTLLQGLVGGMTDTEWKTRGIRGTSKPGFIVWHAARIIDWGVHCAIQGIPEVADRPEWKALRGSELAYGAGITDEEADAVPTVISRDLVGSYLVALKPVVLDWVRRQGDAELAQVPEFERHQRANPRYLTPQVWAEVSDFVDRPAWQILARPCVSHIRVHSGEVETLLHAIRMEQSS